MVQFYKQLSSVSLLEQQMRNTKYLNHVTFRLRLLGGKTKIQAITSIVLQSIHLFNYQTPIS